MPPVSQTMDRGARTLLRVAEPMIAIVLALAAWEMAAQSGLFPGDEMPTLGEILAKLGSDIQTTRLWAGILQSMAAWGLGVTVVFVLAVPIGLLIGSSGTLYALTHVQLEFMRMIPSIAALPLLIFLYGVGFKLTVILVVMTAVWPLIIQTMYGAHDVDPILKDTARLYGLGRFRIFAQIILPSAVPYIVTGLRVSSTIALIIAIATTLVVGGDGLGDLIGSAAQSGQTALMYARIIVTGLLGMAVTGGLLVIERRLLFWHHSQRALS
jgi:NitT/TauT family transport system permease protein